jgi:hypothetical protein
VEFSIVGYLICGYQIVHVDVVPKQVLKKLACREFDTEDILGLHFFLYKGLEVYLLTFVNVEDILLLLWGCLLHFTLILLML